MYALFSCFIKVFPSLLVLLCILSVDIIFSCSIEAFPPFLVLLCVFNLDIFCCFYIRIFPLFCWCSFYFQPGYSVFVGSSTLAHLSCCKILFSFLSFLAVYFLYSLTGNLVSSHAINFSFCLSSSHDTDFLFTSLTTKLLISEEHG